MELKRAWASRRVRVARGKEGWGWEVRVVRRELSWVMMVGMRMDGEEVEEGGRRSKGGTLKIRTRLEPAAYSFAIEAVYEAMSAWI